MGKGRKPCCDKAGVKKGPWSQAEDLKLMTFIQRHGHSNWRALPRLAGLARCGKSCRLRWVNYLRPDLKRGNFTLQEEEAIIKLHKVLGNKWSKIASHFPGRTDNEIKNVWNTHLKKRMKDKESSGDLCNSLQSSSSLSENLDESHKDCSEQVSIPQTSTLDDTAEHSSSSSSSYSSQILFSNHHMEDINPEFHMGALSSNLVDHVYDMDEASVSLDKNNVGIVEELIEIPFEPNLDLWDMLDGDQSSSVDHSEVQFNEVDTPLTYPMSQNDNMNDINKDGSGGSWWWLVYLENELGLDHNERSTSVQSTIGSNHDQLLTTAGKEDYCHM